MLVLDFAWYSISAMMNCVREKEKMHQNMWLSSNSGHECVCELHRMRGFYKRVQVQAWKEESIIIS